MVAWLQNGLFWCDKWDSLQKTLGCDAIEYINCFTLFVSSTQLTSDYCYNLLLVALIRFINYHLIMRKLGTLYISSIIFASPYSLSTIIRMLARI